jgi:hypothetical protein
MRRVLVLSILVGANVSVGQSRDGGKPLPLSADVCAKIVEHVVLISVAATLADDPEVKKLSAKARELTEKLAKQEALADPKFDELKRHCVAAYEKKHETCLLQAKTTKEIDACAAPLPGGR